jgi:hypothetical protein
MPAVADRLPITREIADLFASLPAPQQILEFRPSPAVQTRARGTSHERASAALRRPIADRAQRRRDMMEFEATTVGPFLAVDRWLSGGVLWQF